MSPEETIRKAMHGYPLLWHDSGRAGVLMHMFFVVGNGYDWVDGELVPYDDDDYDEPSYTGSIPEVNQQIAEIEAKVRADLDGYCTRPGWPRSLYPISDYAEIANIPDDVTTEWLALAIEAYNMYSPLYRSSGYMMENGSERVWKPLNAIYARLKDLATQHRLDGLQDGLL